MLRFILFSFVLDIHKTIIQNDCTMESTTIQKISDYDRNFYGCVLGTSENNGYHDSDFFATVWDEEQGCVRTIEDGTTRAYAPSKYSRADATPEVRAKARAWWAREVGPKQGRSVLLGKRLAIDLGSTVEVVKGRKISKGTVAEVVWKGRDAFYRSYGLTYSLPARAFRLGLRLKDGTRVFTSMENVTKLGVEQPSEAEMAEWIKFNNPY